MTPPRCWDVLTHGRREPPVTGNSPRPPTTAFLCKPQRRRFLACGSALPTAASCASPLRPPPSGLGHSWGGPGPGLPARVGAVPANPGDSGQQSLGQKTLHGVWHPPAPLTGQKTGPGSGGPPTTGPQQTAHHGAGSLLGESLGGLLTVERLPEPHRDAEHDLRTTLEHE